MKHLGDITKIRGDQIEAVDVITFGAPCQDLSVAGKRAGMKHESQGDEETTRSGLFFEAIRAIEEMRWKDVHNGRTGQFIRPRFAVYENVPGAFSSNRGEDFKAVLEALVRVVCKNAPDIPIPDGGWSKFGAINGVGDDGTPFSVAWRTHDAQYNGVPQRRQRVCVLADYAGYTAAVILFDPQHGLTTASGEPNSLVGYTGAEPRSEVQPFGESVSGYSEPSVEEGEGTAAATGERIEGTDRERESGRA